MHNIARYCVLCNNTKSVRAKPCVITKTSVKIEHVVRSGKVGKTHHIAVSISTKLAIYITCIKVGTDGTATYLRFSWLHPNASMIVETCLQFTYAYPQYIDR